MKLPLTRETVDMQTGETVTETVYFTMRPAPPGTCPECATDHAPSRPHNAISLFYQYHFYAQHERWPDWRDAMAHCAPDVRKGWTEALERKGVDVAGGKLKPG